MDRDKPLDAFLGVIVQAIVGRFHVGKQRVSTDFRHHARTQDGA